MIGKWKYTKIKYNTFIFQFEMGDKGEIVKNIQERQALRTKIEESLRKMIGDIHQDLNAIFHWYLSNHSANETLVREICRAMAFEKLEEIRVIQISNEESGEFNPLIIRKQTELHIIQNFMNRLDEHR
jgi:hypothetical protein